MLLDKLSKEKLISPPDFCVSNCVYLTMMGSHAYGVNKPESDMDVYGVVITPKSYLFPHTAGYIYGLKPEPPKFDQYEKHGLFYNKQQYDITLYSIINYFNLLTANNPNIIDSIFTPTNCVLHCTEVGHLIRKKRQIFLHQGLSYRFINYAASQRNKIVNKNPEGKRKNIVAEFGYDVKFAGHLIRLQTEALQLLTEGDLDLQRHKEYIKGVRRGDVLLEDLLNYSYELDTLLLKAQQETKLPKTPDYDEIKKLLISCLEIQYGRIDDCIIQPDKFQQTLIRIQNIVAETL